MGGRLISGLTMRALNAFKNNFIGCLSDVVLEIRA